MKNNENQTKQLEERMIRIQIADATGHTALMLTPGQTQEFVEQQGDKWIFVDNKLVREAELDDVNWTEVESVRVMPGLVGGAGSEELNQSLLEEILCNSREEIFQYEDGELWKDGRNHRANAFIQCFQSSLDSNSKALTLLKGVLEENPDKIRIGRNNILIFGDLGSYCIAIENLLLSFHNVYSQNSFAGFESVEIHPKDRWIRSCPTACIQVDSGRHIPSIDTLTGLVLGLMNDKLSFTTPDMRNLRAGLISLYGYDTSPISDVLENYLIQNYPSLEKLDGEFVVSGTDGWKWFIGFSDPEITGYSISSSIKDGPKRLIVEDTRKDNMAWFCLETILEKVTKWPRELRQGDPDFIFENSAGFIRMCNSNKTFAKIRRDAYSNDSFGLNKLRSECQ